MFRSCQVFHELVCPLTVVLPQIFFNLTSLLNNRNVSITSSYSLLFLFKSRNLQLVSALTFHFVVQRRSIVMDLTVMRLTETVSYETYEVPEKGRKKN